MQCSHQGKRTVCTRDKALKGVMTVCMWHRLNNIMGLIYSTTDYVVEAVEHIRESNSDKETRPTQSNARGDSFP